MSQRGFAEQVFSAKRLEHNGDGVPLWESLGPFLSALDVPRAHVTAKSFQRRKEVREARRALLFLLAKHAA